MESEEVACLCLVGERRLHEHLLHGGAAFDKHGDLFAHLVLCNAKGTPKFYEVCGRVEPERFVCRSEMSSLDIHLSYFFFVHQNE